MDSKKMIGGLLAAAAVGVAIGILLAPASGEVTRARLVKGSRKLADDLQGTVEGSIESLKEKFTTGVDQVVKRGKELIGRGSDGAQVKEF